MLSLNFTPFPTLHTDRLVLREIGYDDAQEIFIQRSDPRIMTYLDRAPAVSVEEVKDNFLKKIIEALANNQGITWGIALKGESKLIGTIGFWNIMPEHYRAEIGYTIHPDHGGKGLMQEAMKVVLDYGFETMKLHSVEANVNPDNAPSIKLLERNGFVKEAHFKENWYYNGRFLDSAIYSLVAGNKL